MRSLLSIYAPGDAQWVVGVVAFLLTGHPVSGQFQKRFKAVFLIVVLIAPCLVHLNSIGWATWTMGSSKEI